MNRRTLPSNLATLATLLAALGLSACGGGGGGSGSSSSSSSSSSSGGGSPPPNLGYTLSRSTLSGTAPVTGVEPAAVEINVNITNTTSAFGMGGWFTTSGVGLARWNPVGTTGGTIRVDYQAPLQLTPGVHTDTIRFGFCLTAQCNTIEAATASTITVTYTITAATLPTITMAQSTVSATAMVGDTSPQPQIDIAATATNPAHYGFAGHSTSTSTNGVYSAIFTGQSTSAGRLTVTLKNPNTLAAGTYTDTIQVRMCLDIDCVNPLQVTPSTITVTYTITDTVSGPNGYTARHVAAKGLDAAWSPTRGLLYLAVPGNAPNNPNTVTEFNPVTGAVGASAAAGTTPTLMAISDNDQFLYVAERGNGAIRRYTLSPLTADITIPLGADTSPANEPLFATDLQVQPGHPRVLAVRRSNLNSSPDARGAVLFDDAVQRPSIALPQSSDGLGYLEWDTDGSRLFTNGRIIAVDANGLMAQATLPSINGHFRFANGKLHSDWAQVVDIAAQTGSSFTLDGSPARMTVDVAAGRLYYVTRSQLNIGRFEIEVYNLATLARIATATLPQYQGVVATATRLARWGTNGLVITTTSGDVILVHGALVVP